MTHSVQEKKTRQKGRLNKRQGRIKSPLFQKVKLTKTREEFRQIYTDECFNGKD